MTPSFEEPNYFFVSARGSGKQSYADAFFYNHNISGNTPPPENPKCRITTQKPRDGYIDGGIVLKEGLIITHNEFLNLDSYSWKSFEAWADSMPNIACDELLERKVLWVYNNVPSITSMAA